MNIHMLPKWIKDLPDSDDKEVLTLLHKSSKKGISDPREIAFVINGITNKDDIDIITSYINSAGWDHRITNPTKKYPNFQIEARKYNYIIERSTLFEDQAFFQRLAETYKAVYDGWYASNN